MAKQFNDSKSKTNNFRGKSNRRGNNERKFNKGRNVNKSDSRGTEETVAERNANSMNDIAWYAMSEQLLKDTSSFPYSWMTGLAMRQNRSGRNDMYVVPGIMAAHVTLSPLTLNNAADPINIAARQIVGYIRSFNSGAKNYDPNDLMIRILAEGNFLAFLNYAQRLYGTINMYSSYNKYMPRDLIRMQSCDPDDLRTNMANFRAALNNIITKAASVLYVPDNLPLFKRWAWLFGNYYCDSLNPKDQVYMLTPTGYSKFVIDPNTSAGALEWVDWDNGYKEDPNDNTYLHKWTDIIAALNAMLEPLVEDQELCIMTGDMMKAYGSSAIAFQLIPESMTMMPTYDPLVLQQFKNAKCKPFSKYTQGGLSDWRSIVQDANAQYLCRGANLTFNEYYDAPLYVGGVATTYRDINRSSASEYELCWADTLLDSPNPAPTAVDNMENTRLVSMPLTDDTTISDGDPYTLTAGSEVVEFFSIGYRLWDSVNEDYTFTRCYFRNVINFLQLVDPNEELVGLGGINAYISIEYQDMLESMIRAFDYAPTTYHSQNVTDPNLSQIMQIGVPFKYPHLRISNYAMLSGPTLEKMNNCALLSLINISGFQPKSR